MGKLRPHKITPNIFPDPKLCKNHQLTFSNVSAFLKVESLVIIPYSFKVHTCNKHFLTATCLSSIFQKSYFFYLMVQQRDSSTTTVLYLAIAARAHTHTHTHTLIV